MKSILREKFCSNHKKGLYLHIVKAASKCHLVISDSFSVKFSDVVHNVYQNTDSTFKDLKFLRFLYHDQ